jgi:toxin ParE1/3/4
VRVWFNPKAKTDLQSAVRYIAADSPKAARRWAVSIHAKCAKLGQTPGWGTPKPELGPEIRMLTAGNYLVFYEQRAEGIEILRVLHGARRWQDLL